MPSCIRALRHRRLITDVADAIQVRDVTKSYGGRTVLDAIRLDVLQGETLVILGGSGSGKSTLLRLMIGNVTPDGGDIIVACGKQTSCSMTDDGAGRPTARSIGVLFQSGALFNSMTVADNVAPAAARAHRSARRDDRDHGEDQARAGRPARARRQDARRALRRHEEARRPGPRHRARPQDPVLRRALAPASTRSPAPRSTSSSST